jgi:hypothetical protein
MQMLETPGHKVCMVTAQAPTSYEGRLEVKCTKKFKCKEMMELNWNVVLYYAEA